MMSTSDIVSLPVEQGAFCLFLKFLHSLMLKNSMPSVPPGQL